MPRKQSGSSTIVHNSNRPTESPQILPIRQPSFGQSIKEGFGLGIGVSIARNIVDRVMGSKPSEAPVKPSEATTKGPEATEPIREFKKCMEYKGDYEECKIHLQ